MEERAGVARVCMLRLELAMPTLLDDIENSTDLAYAALPERLYVVGTSSVRCLYVVGERTFRSSACQPVILHGKSTFIP